MVETSTIKRSVYVSGTAAKFSKAFETKIEQYEHEEGTYRDRTGPLTVPAELADIVEGVFGIDNRPMVRQRYQYSQQTPVVDFKPRGLSPFTPPQLANLYNFPTGLDGTGQCIGIIAHTGGFKMSDINTYFSNLGLPVPSIKVASGINNTSSLNVPELTLDIEIAAAIAPKAKIVVYIADNGFAADFLNIIQKAIHDTVNNPSIISISWAGAESGWSDQLKTSCNTEFKIAAHLGKTVLCAAGDKGSRAGQIDGKSHACFPASSPYVTACGGTTLSVNNNTITNEVVWNNNLFTEATGGGVSDFFPVPTYQNSIKIPSVNPNLPYDSPHYGRCIPDVAADADPNPGYSVYIDGQNKNIGGTSAVAPLWAGLIALINQGLGKNVGFLNPKIYSPSLHPGCFRDITVGDNGGYIAKQGWDACTGWGSPNGAKLLAALK
ncbi:S53 family peptidase [Candidatus Magnetomonas plexicatena]|uniref:S53 family peptidase n=1 Tax=Candidatus Magnetomonas plexicatena TaxID=2552947 RepID=UPI004032EEAA